MEDPGYFGASIAFGNVGARIIPVPVDEEGLSVTAGKKLLSACEGSLSNSGSPIPSGCNDVLGTANGRS